MSEANCFQTINSKYKIACGETRSLRSRFRPHCRDHYSIYEHYNVHIVEVEEDDDLLKATVVGTDEVDY